jgi:hypothetical protein
MVGLAPGASVVVEAPRRLTLRNGRLRVACRKDPERKFVVGAGAATATALGTEFSVRITEEPAGQDARPRSDEPVREAEAMKTIVRVVVFSGVVLLANAGGELRLEAGESGRAGGGAKPAKVKDAEDEGPAGKRPKGAGGLEKIGDHVRKLHDQGLRGRELAEAIREKIEELKAAGKDRRDVGDDDEDDEDRGDDDGEDDDEEEDDGDDDGDDEEARDDDGEDDDGMGDYVRALRERGLRGKELSRAIRAKIKELKAAGKDRRKGGDDDGDDEDRGDDDD